MRYSGVQDAVNSNRHAAKVRAAGHRKGEELWKSEMETRKR